MILPTAEQEREQSHSIRFTDREWEMARLYGVTEMGGARQAKVVRKALRKLLREWERKTETKGN